MASEESIKVTAAIDFGTTYSGIAYSHFYNKEAIYFPFWPDGSTSKKVPTAILLDQNAKFLAFGQDAITKYIEKHEEDDEAVNNYFLFHRFKMELYKEKEIDKNMCLLDESGKKEIKAMIIFSECIRFLKEHLIRSLNNMNPTIKLNVKSIRWVLTVPAIWSLSAKQFMREAAETAGIPSGNLVLALEPECASLYCRTAPKEMLPMMHECNKIGAKYLILDNGGGTIDITAHQIIEGHYLKEIYKSTGGAWGGTKVDEGFVKYLKTLFPEDYFQMMTTKHPTQWEKLMSDFETAKRRLSPQLQEDVLSFLVTPGIWDIKFFKSLSSTISKGASILKSRLRIPRKVLERIIGDISSKVQDKVKDLLQKDELKGLNFIMMVGGFSNCAILVNDIRKAVKELGIPVIVPEEAHLSVLRGAVIFGWTPDIVRIRKSKYTYAIEHSTKFDERQDPPGSLVYDATEEKLCSQSIYPLVKVDQEIPIDHTIPIVFTPIYNEQSNMIFSLFASSKEDVKYTSDEELRHIGRVVVDMPDASGNMERNVTVDIRFGDTEFQVKAYDVTSGNAVEARYDFLTLHEQQKRLKIPPRVAVGGNSIN